MSTRYLEANSATGNFPGRNATYAGSESGDSDEEQSSSKPYRDDEKNIRRIEHTDTTATIKSISHEDNAHHKFYKPFSNRTPVLVVFLVVIGVCILLMELAIKTHPDSNNVNSVLRRGIELDSPEGQWIQTPYPLAHEPRNTLEQQRKDGGHMKRSSEATVTTTKADAPSTKSSVSEVTSIALTPENTGTSESTTQNKLETSSIEPPKTSTTAKSSEVDSVFFSELNVQTSKSTAANELTTASIFSMELNQGTPSIFSMELNQDTSTTMSITSTTTSQSTVSSKVEESSSQDLGHPNVSAPAPNKQLVTNTPGTTPPPPQTEAAPATSPEALSANNALPIIQDNFPVSLTSKTSKREEETSPVPVAVTSSQLSDTRVFSKEIVASPQPSDTRVSSNEAGIPSQTSDGAPLSNQLITSQPAVTSAPTTTSPEQETIVTPGQPAPNNQIVTDKPTTTSPGQETIVTVGQPAPNNQIVTDTPTTTPRPISNMADPEKLLDTSSPVTTTNGGTGAPKPNNLLVTTSISSVPGQPNPNNNLVTISTTTSGNSGPSSPVVEPSPNPANQLVTSKPTDNTAPPTVYQPAPNSQLSQTSQNNDVVTSRPISVGSPAPVSQLVTTNPNANAAAVSVTNKVITTVTGLNGVVSTITSAVVSLIGNTAHQASIVSGSVIVSGTSVIGTLSSPAQSGITSGARAGVFTLTNSRGQATATVSFTGAVVLTNSDGQATATVSYTASQAASTGASNSGSKAALQEVPWNQFSYFFAKYLPNILAVILQATWLIIFATFKMMEPFYQLASPRGASAESSLTADYLSAGLSLSFIKAAIDGHWVMLLAGAIQLLLALTVSFSSDAFNIVPTAFCQTQIGRQPCAPKWVVNMRMARTVEVLLVGCFSMVLMIIVFNLRRKSGVYTDPSKIATMADILVHRPFIQELRDLPASATQAEIELDLKDNRYMLGTFVVNGRQQYGIIKLDVLPQTFKKEPYMSRLGRRFDFWWETVVENFERKLPYASDFLCIFFAFALWSIVLAYYLIPGTDETNPLNVFMGRGKDRFGATFCLSMIAVAMGFLLKHKERDYRLSHPYVLMSKGPQLADQCITTGLRSTQYSALPKSVYSKDITLALLSMAAILSDMNLLLVPGIPWTSAQTTEVYKGSTYGCLIIVSIIIVVHVRATFKQWRRGHHIESPGTLATVLMRLCGSRFVEEKNNQAVYGPVSTSVFWEDDDQQQRRRYGGPEKGRKYRFGCMEGVDGVQRYMVEEDFWSQKQPSTFTPRQVKTGFSWHR